MLMRAATNDSNISPGGQAFILSAKAVAEGFFDGADEYLDAEFSNRVILRTGTTAQTGFSTQNPLPTDAGDRKMRVSLMPTAGIARSDTPRRELQDRDRAAAGRPKPTRRFASDGLGL